MEHLAHLISGEHPEEPDVDMMRIVINGRVVRYSDEEARAQVCLPLLRSCIVALATIACGWSLVAVALAVGNHHHHHHHHRRHRHRHHHLVVQITFPFTS